jgi:transposase
MMVALLLHGYASGLYSSRRIAKACRERNDFVIVALDPPDFRTISDFRNRDHLRQSMPVIGIARQRLHVGDELAAR